MKIKEITWNWQHGLMESNGDRIDVYSDTCEKATVGINGVRKIHEVCTDFCCYYEVVYDSKILQVFKPNTVLKEK